MHPHDFEKWIHGNDNIMKSLSQCLYIYEFSWKLNFCNFNISLVMKCMIKSGQFDVYMV